MKSKKKTENEGSRTERKKKYDLENLKKALLAVKSGMSKKQAAKEYQVPRSTIQFRLNHPEKINPRPGPTTVLTNDEENVLVNWIIQSSKKGFPRRKEDIQYSVSDFLKKSNRPNPFKNDLPGDKWLKLFLKRHPEVAVRTPESVTAASSVVSENDIRAWFHGIENYLKDNALFDILSDPSRVFNGDETNFLLCPKTGVVLALKGDKNVYEIDRGQAKSSITVMFTLCANGDLTPPMIILPYKRLPGDIANKVPEEWGIGLSDNGWMKAELFYDYIKNVLHPYLLKKGQMFPIILFVDGHKTHLTLQVSELCSNLKIILIALYPNCTRILQPADVAAFFPLKCAWKQSVLRWRRDHPAQALTKTDFVPILKAAIDVSLKPATIKNGFKACGLLPWDPDALDYTKCLGNSKGKEISQPHCLGTDASDRNRMTKEDFINIVGMETINKINNKDIHMIMDAPKLLQNLWEFFGNSLVASKETDIESPAISNYETSENLLEQEHLNIENINVIFADNVEQFNEISNIPYSHEVEIQNTSEPNLPVVSVITEEHLTLPANQTASTLLPKTPIKLNLTPVHLNDILILPKTPQRKGTKNSEKTPFVLTSEEWQRIYTEKKKAKELKEEGIKRRKLEREQKKLHKDQSQGKGKGKGKKTRGIIQNVKKNLMSKEFYLPSPQANDKENTSQNIQNKAKVELNDRPIEKQEDYIFPSTSSRLVKKSFTADEIFKMLAESDDENN